MNYRLNRNRFLLMSEKEECKFVFPNFIYLPLSDYFGFVNFNSITVPKDDETGLDFNHQFRFYLCYRSHAFRVLHERNTRKV
jgi:hypothetical protein